MATEHIVEDKDGQITGFEIFQMNDGSGWRFQYFIRDAQGNAVDSRHLNSPITVFPTEQEAFEAAKNHVKVTKAP